MEKVTRAFSSIWYLLLVAALATTMACTKNAAPNKSKVTLTLPDFSGFRSSNKASTEGETAAATWEIGRIMLNVSGPGMPAPAFIFWERHQSPGTTPPSSMTIDVPQGTARLIQVLVAARDTSSTDGAEQFFYKDGVYDLLSETPPPVDLTLEPLATAVGEGLVSGRFLLGDGSGPTGKVDMWFVPGPGKQPMIVSKTEIHGGWFTFFALPGIAFKYTLGDGTSILGDLKADDLSLISGSAQNMAIKIPASYRQDGGSNYRVLTPQTLQLGFFGPGAAGKVACYDSATGKNFSRLFTNSTGTTALPWAGPTAPTSAQGGVVRGGQGATNAVCSGTEYGDFLRFDIANFQDSHGALAMRGPFQPKSTGNGYPTFLQATPQAGGIALSWKYLPGTTGAGRISGVGIFARVVTTTNNYGRRDYEQDDGIICNKLTDPKSLQIPFTFIKDVDHTLDTVSLTAADLAFAATPMSDFSAGKLHFVACPKKDGSNEYFNSGIDYTGSGGGGGGPRIMISGTQSVPSGTCTPFTLTHSMNDVDVAPSSPVTVTLYKDSSSGPSANFYATNTCSGGGAPITSTTMSTATKTVYYSDSGTSGVRSLKASMSQGAQGSLNIAVGGGGSAPNQFHFTSETSSSANFVQGGCYSVDIGLKFSGTFQNPSAFTVHAQILDELSATVSDSALYSDGRCQTAIPSNQVQFAAGEFFKTVFFKTSITTTGPQTLGASDAGTLYPLNINLASAVPTSLTLTKDGNGGGGGGTLWYQPGSCMGLQMQTSAVNSAMTSVGTSQNATFSSANAVLTTDSTCQTGLLTSISTPVTSSSAPNWGNQYRMTFAQMPTSGPVTASVAISDPALTANATFYQQPDSVAITGLPASGQFIQNYCLPVVLEARWGGSLATLPANLDFGMMLPPGFSIFGNPNCTSPLANTSVNGGSPSSLQAFIRTDTAGASGNAILGVNGANTSQVNSPVSTVAPLNASHFVVKNSNSNGGVAANISVGACVAIIPGLATGVPTLPHAIKIAMQALGTTNLVANANGGTFYTNNICTTSAGADPAYAMIPAGTSGGGFAPAQLYVKFIGTTFSATAPAIQISAPYFNPAVTVLSSYAPVCTVGNCTW